jgi:hypothetical protein
MTKAEFEELRTKWQAVSSITPWEEVKIDSVYHIPPVLGLGRREIKVTGKTDDEVTFTRVDGIEENANGTFKKTSVFAKCMVQVKEF